MKQEKGLILVTLTPDRALPDFADKLSLIGGGREVLITSDRGEMEKVLDKVEILIGFIPWNLLVRLPRLAWVQLWSAGADGLMRHPEVKKLPLKMTNVSGMHALQISEHIFGMILAWNRRFPEIFAAQSRREWVKPDGAALSVLSGKTMLILGYGAIGKQTARIGIAFGMKIIGLRRRVPAAGDAPDPDSEAGVRVEGASKLRELLPGADFVVNILPLTEDTKHIIGKAEFEAMKESALYINVGRGATTDEAALIKALETKSIGGALLDVTETEPLPPDSPLWNFGCVILSGHYAGLCSDYSAVAQEITLDNLGRYVRGDPLKNLVNMDAGY
jgi:phosphoglycerate dehydrogenase-like enzyme